MFTMTLQSFISADIEHAKNDCTLSSSATASLDFAVTGSGELPATIQSDVQTAIDDTSSNGFAEGLETAADATARTMQGQTAGVLERQSHRLRRCRP